MPAMKLSWILLILLLVFVAIFSVQNAEPMTVRLLSWEITMSAALVIQLAALLGALVGLTAGARSRRSRDQVEREAKPADRPMTEKQTSVPPTTQAPKMPAVSHPREVSHKAFESQVKPS
jgi:uncharacterized integral membrane protein